MRKESTGTWKKSIGINIVGSSVTGKHRAKLTNISTRTASVPAEREDRTVSSAMVFTIISAINILIPNRDEGRSKHIQGCALFMLHISIIIISTH